MIDTFIHIYGGLVIAGSLVLTVIIFLQGART